jgi:guanylate kinase
VTPKVVVLSAPSGGGKTTIARALVERRPDIGYSVSATTRKPRTGERDDEAYHFLTRPEFERRVQGGDFLEWAVYAGELYGTLKDEVSRVLAGGRHVVLAIDVAGARAVRGVYAPPRSVTVFILPPTAATLVERLTQRRTDDRGTLVRRLELAADELRQAPRYDHIVVNDDIDHAVTAVERIIDGAARPRMADAELDKRLQALSEELSREVARLGRIP